ncbi:hypothetical protein [Mucilaginibacter flavidus]|uniref:hypothetical protein n=1 Tax=Mucilaginibacter flavidus TaxID=2949309 RepID=UPI0020931FFD|nr:hypothetical protein [Mucilaginibacter flavidus]MCO5945344.1 hypothetical protein [Mucilaginibacter flavidus]
MAIWQFNINFIPRKSLINKYGYIPEQLEINSGAWEEYFKNSNLDEEYDFEDAHTIRWWLDLKVSTDDLYPLIKEGNTLNERTIPGLMNFGNVDTNHIDVCFDENTNQVEELSCRVDLREVDKVFVNKIFALAECFNCLLMDRQGRLFEPTKSAFINAIKLSDAFRFVSNPEGFLNDISTGAVKPE